MDIIGDIVAIGKTVLKSFYNTLYPNISSGSGAPTSTPAKILDFYKKTDSPSATYVSNGTSSSADWKKLNGSYEIKLFSPSITSPNDGATYYAGTNPSMPSGSAASLRSYIPRGGVITSAYVSVYAQATFGSNETFSAYIRLNNTTDYLISDQLVATAASQFFTNIALNIPVAQLDYVVAKIVCPTWATNPAAISFGITLGVDLSGV